jgi:uncharacterized membrane protein YsdA (DUF1294 family)
MEILVIGFLVLLLGSGLAFVINEIDDTTALKGLYRVEHLS